MAFEKSCEYFSDLGRVKMIHHQVMAAHDKAVLLYLILQPSGRTDLYIKSFFTRLIFWPGQDTDGHTKGFRVVEMQVFKGVHIGAANSFYLY